MFPEWLLMLTIAGQFFVTCVLTGRLLKMSKELHATEYLLTLKTSLNTEKGTLYEHHELDKEEFAQLFAEGFNADGDWTDNPYPPDVLSSKHAAWFQGWQRRAYERRKGIDYDRVPC